MPPSQLKQLKASLRDSGVIRQQQSKKQKRQNAKTGAGAQDRVQRNAALQAIRDRFNPFEIKVAPRSKFDVTTRDVGSYTICQLRLQPRKQYLAWRRTQHEGHSLCYRIASIVSLNSKLQR